MAPKPKTAPVTKKAPAGKAKPKGLQLSAAQWKAYTSAYNSVANAGFTKLAIQSSAQGLRKYRLGAVYGLSKKVAAAHAAARTAAIAKFAAAQTLRQSRLGHQNKALQNRVYANYARHVQVAARLQFAYRGEKVYLHTAVMNTLTTAQAVKIEAAAYARAAKAAKAAVTSTTTKAAANAKPSPAVTRITAAAKAAGLAAARATPAGRTAPRPPDIAPGLFVPRAYGDPKGYDCVAAAIANHLLYATGARLGRRGYYAMAGALGDAPCIADALELVMLHPPWGTGGPLLAGYATVPVPAPGNRKLVIGVCSPEGAHAAVLLETGSVVSWGETLPLDEVRVPGTDVAEAWDLLWLLPRTPVLRSSVR